MLSEPCEAGEELPSGLGVAVLGCGMHEVRTEHQLLAAAASNEEGLASLYDVGVTSDSSGNVRFTGTVVNETDYALQSAAVVVALLDRTGAVVGLGSAPVVAGLEPGQTDTFDLRIPDVAYTHFDIRVEGVRQLRGAGRVETAPSELAALPVRARPAWP
jgi:hypothetical protein